ncbi:MAG: hypothetical protein AB7F86_20310, partial [Bdellovibrionales bacterium]
TCQWPGEVAENCQYSTSRANVAEGRYLIKVAASDRAGNVADPRVHDLIVDRTPPVITFLSSPPAVGNSGAVDYSFNVTDDRAGVKSIECAFEDKASYQNCASPVAKNFADGPHKFFVRATDLAGNSSEAEHAFVVDSLAPTVVITKSPPDYSKSPNATFEFEGKDGLDPISDFECRMDSGAFESCSSPKLYTALSDGVHTFQVVGIDKVGNRSAPATRSWYIDTKAPEIKFILTPPALSRDVNATFKYNIVETGSGLVKSECALDGGAYGDCPSDGSSFVNLPAGDHTFQVRATDKAGNVGSSELVKFKIDLTPPAISLTAVPTPYTKNPDFQFGFLATDENGIERVECRLDAQVFVTCDTQTNHWTRGLAEGGHRFTVRAVDKAGNTSAEIYYDWSIDLTGPVIAYFQMPPAATLSSAVVTLGFSVTDNLSGVKSVSCKLDGVAIACKADELKTLPPLSTGVHSFVVVAEDNAGNVVEDIKSISVNPPVLKTQQVEVKGQNKVDILVVVDNSGSMANEQANMASRFSNFLAKIQDLDWQIGVITTDVDYDAPLKDGRILELDTMPGQYILNSSMSSAQAQEAFGQTVQLRATGSPRERGFHATMRAIDRAFDSANPVNAPNAQLLRADAATAVIVISDAYDDSGKRPEDVLAAVNSRWGGQIPFVFHSIVVPESIYTLPAGGSLNAADPCKNYRESVKFDGREYHRLSQMTGGIKGTVCSEDYGSQLSEMGRVTAELVNSVTLMCPPLDANGDGSVNTADVEVKDANGVAITAFTLEGTKLTFQNSLPLGQNSLKYYCAQ